jgi:formiminotetrahydrofolate cyclodeaminase
VEIKETIPFAIYSAIVDALDHAREKHPHFADTDAEAGTVIAEELLEVNTAALKVMQGINDQADRDNLFEELAQLNATTIRMMEKLLKCRR